MRILTAGIATETNTFVPWPTTMADFIQGGLFHGDTENSATRSKVNTDMNEVARLFQELAARDGHEFVEGLFAYAQPSGPTRQEVWETLRNEIVEEAKTQGPFDVILLYLHGAMVATGCDDCESDLVQQLRQVTNQNTVIGVELDPHCHLSNNLVEQADVVILMKEYPHTDYLARAAELYDLCLARAHNTVVPVASLFDLRMVGFYPTTKEPMAGLLRQLREIEHRTDILSVSFAHGFPWGDTPDAGSKVLVYSNQDAALAARTARELGLKIYAERESLLPRMPDIGTALDSAQQSTGLVVLADTADNAGGGAPGDNVSLLRAMLERGMQQAVCGAVWDPESVELCCSAGTGARIQLSLGGKSGKSSGLPLDITATVRAIRINHEQAGLGTSSVAMGTSVWLLCDGIDILVSSLRGQVFTPSAFTGIGITMDNKRFVAVKSSQHFHAGFAPIADAIIFVATPGAIQMNFADIEYLKRRDFNYFPRTADPLGIAEK